MNTIQTENKRDRILIIDDNPNNLNVLIEHLHSYEISVALNGKDGIKLAHNINPDLILLDVMMPGIDGFETCRRLKEDESISDIPIIFLTALEDMENKLKGFQVGGVDYITKPIKFEEALARINAHLTIRRHEKELERKNKLILEQVRQLDYLARTDSLTKLPNRRDFMEHANMEMSRYKRNGSPFSIVMIDIDFFKKINDAFGHECGDYVLVETAECIRKNLRTHDHIARWGGEEFIILLPETESEGAVEVAEKIRCQIQDDQFIFGSYCPEVRLTLGVSAIESGKTLQDCIRMADQALYRGKKSGRNKVVTAKKHSKNQK